MASALQDHRILAHPARDQSDETRAARHLALVPALPADAPAPDWRAQMRVYLSIMKPITWVPVIWSFLCGAVAANALTFDPVTLLKLVGGFLLAGPLLCGMGQAVNDYFDREVDAVNEPWRVIPSRMLSIRQVFQVIALLGFTGLVVAYLLGQFVLGMAFAGIFMAHHYSAPPLRLKARTWLGPATSAFCYIFIPWLAAESAFAPGGWFSLRSVLVAGLYSVGGVGIMILNDFKSVRGDYQLRLPSVPVRYGLRKAAWLAVAAMDAAQIAVVAALLWEGRPVAATIVALLIVPQLVFQCHFVQKPLARAIWYNARAQNFFVLGMLIAAWVAI